MRAQAVNVSQSLADIYECTVCQQNCWWLVCLMSVDTASHVVYSLGILCVIDQRFIMCAGLLCKEVGVYTCPPKQHCIRNEHTAGRHLQVNVLDICMHSVFRFCIAVSERQTEQTA